MKSINLIPPDERRGAGGAGGRSAGGAYVLLGALVALVAMVATYSLTVKSAHDRSATLAQVKRDTVTAEAKAASLSSYTAFKTMRAQRVETVKSIASSRFDWAHAMHELARTLPRNAVLSDLRGTVASGVPVKTGPTITVRSSMPDLPAIEMVGCVPDQDAVAHMLVNLRRIDGVRQVTLQQSQRSSAASGTSAAAPAASASGTGAPVAADCDYQFQVVVFYDAVKAITPPVVPGAATTAAATTTAAQPAGASR